MTAAKIKKICNKSFDNYVHALEFDLNCYKTHKMCNKAVNTFTSAMQFVPECCKCMLKLLIYVLFCLILFLIDIRLKKMCDKAVSNDPFTLKYCIDKSKTKEICDKVVDDFFYHH